MSYLREALQLRGAERTVRSGRARGFARSATLRTRFPEIESKIARRVSTAMRQTANAVAEGARERVNLGPPDIHIRDRIRVDRQAPATYAVIAGDEEAFYGHIVEFGSVTAAPRPFLIPALEAERQPAERRARAALRGL